MSDPMLPAPAPTPADLLPPPPSHWLGARRRLFLASFLILFLELAAIRWFGSTVVFLTFFTNIVLLASFLGMSIGLLNASRRVEFLRSTIPILFAAIATAQFVFWLWRVGGVPITVGEQRVSPQLIYFGTEYRVPAPDQFFVPIEAVAAFFFVMIAAMFVGIGQAMGRAFDAIDDRVRAYTIDVLGSLAGIGAFAAASWFQTPPIVWFAIALVATLALLPRREVAQFALAGIALALIGGALTKTRITDDVYWSPYYKVVHGIDTGLIDTNNIAHQQMHRISTQAPAYSLPHLLNRDAGNPPFADVMIIGAGSGNDVAAALAYGARHVDAVEIDPVINGIGRRNHPDKPYDDPRVTIHLDDGRRFTRRTDATYDLAIYALVDSLVLHSGYSSIRLESFLFTEQAFRDVKARLKPGGVFATYNYYRKGWVIGRIEQMAERVFGTKPIVVSLPYQPRITSEEAQADHITFVLCGSDASALEKIRKQFETSGSFWVNEHTEIGAAENRFAATQPTEPAKGWSRISPAEVETSDIGPLPTDDWPQLYLREPRVPTVSLRGGAIMAILSLAMLAAYTIRPRGTQGGGLRIPRPNLAMFFLGAGFMLLESKGVVHMALLFGSTWIVNSVVFAAVLVMILCANLYVARVRPRRLWPYYALLAASLLVNGLVPMDYFLSLPGATKTIASCAVVFVPIFFAGVIFATRFRDSANPGVDFGSNVAGVILGGLSENLSLVVGFNALLLVALGYYAFAMASGVIIDRRGPAAIPS